MSARRTIWLLVAVVLLGTSCTANRQLAERGRPGFRQRGLASWYGPGFHGKLTANGEVYDMHALTAAHKQLPFGTVVDVRNNDNGRKVQVRINDRGPFVRGRIIDLSRAAAERIGLVQSGVASVTLTVVNAGRSTSRRALRASEWIVQAGAFRDLDRAQKQLERVRAIDRRAHIDGDGSLYRVVVGPFGGEKEARRILAALRERRVDAILRRSG